MPHDVRAPSMVIFATRLCSRHNLSTDVRITPLRGRCRYLAQRRAINICRNNQAVGKTDNTWYGKENEKKRQTRRCKCTIWQKSAKKPLN